LAEYVRRSGATFAVVRSWDSTRDPVSLARWFQDYGATATAAGAVFALRGVDPDELAARFFHFDEIWLGPDDVDWSRLEDLRRLTTDVGELNEENGAPFRLALLESGALVGLGDGDGLNVVRLDLPSLAGWVPGSD
ncbi:MAG: hypothetical protein AAFZ87_15490, partial [Planctomycetota bacterium]